MATRFANIDRDTPLLLPPDLRDWVPASHLAHFIIDAVEALDLRVRRENKALLSESFVKVLQLAQELNPRRAPRGFSSPSGENAIR